jgi:hypothetical protein
MGGVLFLPLTGRAGSNLFKHLVGAFPVFTGNLQAGAEFVNKINCLDSRNTR